MDLLKYILLFKDDYIVDWYKKEQLLYFGVRENSQDIVLVVHLISYNLFIWHKKLIFV